MKNLNWLIATDLDGTLLDDTYAYATAGRAIDHIEQAPDTAVVLASSKTLPELLHFVRFMSARPFLLFENGGGLAWPTATFAGLSQQTVGGYDYTLFDQSIHAIRVALQTIAIRHRFDYLPMHAMTDAELTARTHLPQRELPAARERLTSEPILWRDTRAKLDTFKRLLQDHRLAVIPGGRFLHIHAGSNKHRTLQHLRRHLCYQHGLRPKVLACGDAENDRNMLAHADRALVFPGRDGRYLSLPRSRHCEYAKTVGPQSWLAGIKHLLPHLKTVVESTSDE